MNRRIEMTRLATVSRIFAGLLLVIAFTTQRAEAQTALEIGPRIGYEVDDWESLFLGADVRIDMAALPVAINPYFDYYFLDNDDVSLIQFGANALYHFGIANQAFTPYAGAGLALSRISYDIPGVDGDTEAGLNLLFGARFGFGQMRPFAQAQFTLGDADFFSIAGGLLFRLGQ